MRRKLMFFGDKIVFFLGEGPNPSITPYTLDAYGAAPPPYWNPKYASVETHAVNSPFGLPTRRR